MPGTFTPAFFENAKTNDWCQCASVLSHLKVLQFTFTYERCPNHCLKNLSNFIVFSHIYTPSDSNFQSKSNCYIFGAGVPSCANKMVLESLFNKSVKSYLIFIYLYTIGIRFSIQIQWYYLHCDWMMSDYVILKTMMIATITIIY